MALREGAFRNPSSYFNGYAQLSDEEAGATAMRIWNEINLPNLIENVLPTRHRATLVLQKSADHTVGGGAAAQAVTARCRSPRRAAIDPLPGHNTVRSWRSPRPGVRHLHRRHPRAIVHRASRYASSPSAMRIPSARGARSDGGGPSRTAGSSASGMYAPAVRGSPPTPTPAGSRCCSTGRMWRRSPSRRSSPAAGLRWTRSRAGRRRTRGRTASISSRWKGRARASSRGTDSGSNPRSRPGTHMVAHDDVDDETTPRIARWLGEFAAAELPEATGGGPVDRCARTLHGARERR